MKACYLKLNDGSGRFERVDEYVFKNRAFALDANGESRYTEDYVLVHDQGMLDINFSGPVNSIGVICRILGEQPPTSASSSKGFYDEPEHVYFKRAKSEYLYDLHNGKRWKRAA